MVSRKLPSGQAIRSEALGLFLLAIHVLAFLYLLWGIELVAGSPYVIIPLLATIVFFFSGVTTHTWHNKKGEEVLTYLGLTTFWFTIFNLTVTLLLQ